jgi:2-(3-amino-3-carboxypropyl)histidine synthase
VKVIANEVEAFLFIGGGRFHAVGVGLSTSKPVVVADPYLKEAYSIDHEIKRVLMQRWASINKARNAKTFGVIIGLKVGQKKLKKALEVKKKLEETGKKALLLALREITPEKLMQFPSFEAYVNTACPRLSLDDAPRFPKPLLTPKELQVLLREISWEELCRKGWFENEG